MDFSYFKKNYFDNVIKPAVLSCEDNLDKQFMAQSKLGCKLQDESYAYILHKKYEEKYRWLHKVYYHKECDNDINTLDLHKQAALMCRVMLMCKVFSFDIKIANQYKSDYNNDNDWLINNYLVNYKVAIDIALGITLYDLVDRLEDLKGEKNPNNLYIDEEISEIGRVAKLDYYNNPLLPQERKIQGSKNFGHDNFYVSLIKNLAKNDIAGREFDYLSFATIMYQLQQYNVVKFNYDKLKSQQIRKNK